MNLYHIKLTDNQKNALNYLFAQDIKWNKTELEKAWHDLREQLKESVQCVAIIDALQDSGCNCKKPTEPAPKYDPCRKFRNGDKVRAVEYKGRKGTDCPNFTGKIYTVSQEERSNGLLKLTDDVYVYYIDPAYVELVTPVEEPYCISAGEGIIEIWKRKSEVVKTWYYDGAKAGLKAKAAAKAECDRLNAEYRKEQI